MTDSFLLILEIHGARYTHHAGFALLMYLVVHTDHVWDVFESQICKVISAECARFVPTQWWSDAKPTKGRNCFVNFYEVEVF